MAEINWKYLQRFLAFSSLFYMIPRFTLTFILLLSFHNPAIESLDLSFQLLTYF